MADSDPKDLTASLSSRGQAPVVALVLILATTLAVHDLSPRPGANPPAPHAAATAGAATPAPARPAPGAVVTAPGRRPSHRGDSPGSARDQPEHRLDPRCPAQRG